MTSVKSAHFSDEHELFRATVRRFVLEEVEPHAHAWETAGAIPRSIFVRMGELGLLGVGFPEQFGGSGGDLFHAVAMLEELPRSRMGGFCAAASVHQFIATQHILRFGSESLQQRYLPGSIAGRLVGALAVSEPDAGSDVAAMRTTARRDGDSYVVDGAKIFITNGVDGDFVTLAVRTAPAGAQGISLLVVDRDLPGIAAKRLNKMGWHSSDTAELSFENVRVPVDRLIGSEGHGFAYLMEAFQLERLVAAALAVGSCDVCVEDAWRQLNDRTSFGRPLTHYQALTHKLAALEAELEAARQLTYHAAWLQHTRREAVRETSMAKLITTELNKRIADAALQCFGGYGYIEETPIARAYRDARVGTIAGGTSEIMCELIARPRIVASRR